MAELKFSYDAFNDVLTVEGKRFHGEIFRKEFGGIEITPPDTCLRIIEKPQGVLDGVVVMQRIEKHESRIQHRGELLERAGKYLFHRDPCYTNGCGCGLDKFIAEIKSELEAKQALRGAEKSK